MISWTAIYLHLTMALAKMHPASGETTGRHAMDGLIWVGHVCWTSTLNLFPALRLPKLKASVQSLDLVARLSGHGTVL
jgi:hypothetical protein